MIYVNRKTTIGIIVVVLAIIISTASIYTIFFRSKSDSSEGSIISSSYSTSAVPVIAIRARTGNLIQYIDTIGRIKTLERLELLSQVPGHVKNVFVTNGDVVSKNDLLIKIEEEPFRIALQGHRSSFLKSLRECVQELKITQTPHASIFETYFHDAFTKQVLAPLPGLALVNSIPQDDRRPLSISLTPAEYMVLARHDIAGSYSQVKQGERELKQTSKRAPFRGVISDVQVTEGTYVTPNKALLTLTSLDHMQIEIKVLEEDLQSITSGAAFMIYNDAGETIYNGNVTGIDPTVEKETHTGKAYGNIDNPSHFWKNEQFVHVRIEKQTFRDRLLIPRESILTRNDRDLVFLVKGNVAKWQYIEPGISNDQFVEIFSGVTEGDTVIIGGHYSLAHNARVEVSIKNNK